MAKKPAPKVVQTDPKEAKIKELRKLIAEAYKIGDSRAHLAATMELLALTTASQ